MVLKNPFFYPLFLGGFFVVGWALLDSHVGIKHAVFAKEKLKNSRLARKKDAPIPSRKFNSSPLKIGRDPKGNSSSNH